MSLKVKVGKLPLQARSLLLRSQLLRSRLPRKMTDVSVGWH